jgi:hypothetical protein
MRLSLSNGEDTFSSVTGFRPKPPYPFCHPEPSTPRVARGYETNEQKHPSKLLLILLWLAFCSLGAKPRHLRSPHTESKPSWKYHPPLCHPDRSEAQRRDLRLASHRKQTQVEVPPSPLSSRPERSAAEGPAVLRTCPGNVFLIAPARLINPATKKRVPAPTLNARPLYLTHKKTI